MTSDPPARWRRPAETCRSKAVSLSSRLHPLASCDCGAAAGPGTSCAQLPSPTNQMASPRQTCAGADRRAGKPLGPLPTPQLQNEANADWSPRLAATTSAFQGCALASSASIDWMAREDGSKQAGIAALVTELVRYRFSGYCARLKSCVRASVYLGIPGA